MYRFKLQLFSDSCESEGEPPSLRDQESGQVQSLSLEVTKTR